MPRFGSFPEAIAAEPHRLAEIKGMGEGAIAEFKIVEAAAQRFARGAVKKRLPMGSWTEVVDYCRTSMAFENREIFRILFLDKKNGLIADEVQGSGTVDHTPVYPREVVRRALELSATAIVLVHNHPSGDPSPSTQDVKMTLDIIAIAKPLGRRRARPHHRRAGRSRFAPRDEADLNPVSRRAHGEVDAAGRSASIFLSRPPPKCRQSRMGLSI